jgi:glycine betaine/proline transport system permease protein
VSALALPVLAAGTTEGGIPRLPFGSWVDVAVDWVTSTFRGLFAAIKDLLSRSR